MSQMTTGRDRQGFTLIEVMVAVIIVGLMVLIGIPRMRNITTHSDTHSAKSSLVTWLNRAKGAAVETSRTTTFNVNGNLVWVTASPRLVALGGSTADTIGRVDNFGTRYGVTVSPNTVITFDTRGIPSAAIAATTIVVTKQGIRDSVTVSAYGRIQK